METLTPIVEFLKRMLADELVTQVQNTFNHFTMASFLANEWVADGGQRLFLSAGVSFDVLFLGRVSW